MMDIDSIECKVPVDKKLVVKENKLQRFWNCQERDSDRPMKFQNVRNRWYLVPPLL